MPSPTFKVTKPSIITLLYQLMYNITSLLDISGIPYWVCGGSFLGAIRNKGIIPNDDDCDIGIMVKHRNDFLKLKSQLKKCGCSISSIFFGYKLFFSNRRKIAGTDYSFPSLDIFLYKEEGNYIVQYYKAARDAWPKEKYAKKDLFPLKKYPFGEISVTGPNQYEPYLSNMYGSDWFDVTYKEYDHSTETGVEKVKVRLTNKDRVPARPSKGISRKCLTNICYLKQKGVNYISKVNKRCRKIDNHCMKNFEVNMGTYLIHCDKHVDRLKKFDAAASKAKLIYCIQPCTDGKKLDSSTLCSMQKKKLLADKVDMTPIEIAIALSHYNTWVRIINNCQEYGLIFEDDVQVNPNFITKVNALMRELQNDDFNILYLWNGNWAKNPKKQFVKIDNMQVIQEKTPYNAGGVAYIISAKFCKYLIEKMIPIKYPQDMFIGMKVGVGLHLSLLMKVERGCYVSPILDSGSCEGPYSTGDSTQEHESIRMRQLSCKKCTK